MKRNYITLGPVVIRLARAGLADWGYPLIVVRGGLSLFSRNSSGEMVVASYHPSGSPTWAWSVTWRERQPDERLISWTPKDRRRNQWHDYVWRFRIARQDYHKQPRPTPETLV
jgi:hypothetical protein